MNSVTVLIFLLSFVCVYSIYALLRLLFLVSIIYTLHRRPISLVFLFPGNCDLGWLHVTETVKA